MKKTTPRQGFLMADYTKDVARHFQRYEKDLDRLDYTYVYLDDSEKVTAFLIAYTREEWLEEVPNWAGDIYWHPEFDKSCLDNFVLVNQRAMYPNATGQGIGSQLEKVFCADLRQDGIENIFSETVIAPTPNLASLNFRIKQGYQLVGMRYEPHGGTIFTTLVYYKQL